MKGLGDVLKWYDPKGESLELELGDMMVHGMYRIVAVDHDLISFVDVELPRKQLVPHPVIPLTPAGNIIWPTAIQPAPIVLITNPKDARFAMPTKEPLHRIQSSSHIRFLVFTSSGDQESNSSNIVTVHISIDGVPHPHAATQSSATLWTAPWDPTTLDPRRTHKIQIQVTTPDGQTGSSSVVFRLDNQRVNIKGGPGEFIISSNMALVVSSMIFYIVSSYCSPLSSIASRIDTLWYCCHVDSTHGSQVL